VALPEGGQASTGITSHPGSRTTSHPLAGNHVEDAEMRGSSTTDHWYFPSAVEAWAKPSAAAAVMLGGLAHRRAGLDDQHERPPAGSALDRLQSHPATPDIAIVNQAAGGNRVLNDGLGPNVLARLDREVLARSGVKWLVVFEGVNDIGTAEATPAA